VTVHASANIRNSLTQGMAYTERS